MANIREHRDKSGKLISYYIRVHRGRGPDGKQLKPYIATFEVKPTWTEKSARKRPRLLPRPSRRNAGRESHRTAVRPSRHIVLTSWS